MDVQMPEMDGHEATRRIRQDERFADLPIIGLTAHVMLEEQQRCLDAGMNDHVAKPINPEIMFATLSRWISRASEAPSEPSAPGEQPTFDLSVLNNFDTEDGLSRVVGNHELYLRLLRQYRDSETTVINDIKKALSVGNQSAALKRIHTTIGMAGNLGAKAVHEAASALEEAFLAEDDDRVRASLDVFFREQQRVLEDLRSLPE